MDTNLFSQFAPAIRCVDLNKVTDATRIPDAFLLAKDGQLTSHYIPFDYVNANAKVVLVGITPGFTQWKNAMQEAQRQLSSGASLEAAHVSAKRIGAFSGTLRPNLVALLDSIGIQKWLKIASCNSLFGADSELLQSTSILSHPIFAGGENYSGAPSMIKTPFLQKQLLNHFAQEAALLKSALYIPLGPKVSEGLDWLVKKGVLKDERILHGLPHPSGANAERISYFLGQKDKSALSVKTNAAKLDAARKTIVSRMQLLG